MGLYWATRFGFAARIFLLSDGFRLVWEPLSLLRPLLFLWESGWRLKLHTLLWLVFDWAEQHAWGFAYKFSNLQKPVQLYDTQNV
jgi:hypothetical protein